MWWDYSTAGRLSEDGLPIAENDADGNHNYLSIKGSFVWDQNVEPEYYWFNGTADHFLYEDTIETIPVKINELFGNYHDEKSKIWPVKVHRGRQPYDTVHNTLISLRVWAPEEGMGAFWKDFDFNEAAEVGMRIVGREYSGKMDFIETEAFWPINHMVSPKEDVVSCTECHSRDGRLQNLNDFYLPGRDYNKAVNYGGFALIIISLIGVFVHALGRIISHIRNK